LTQLAQRAAGDVASFDAVLNVVVDELLLGVRDGDFNGSDLLGEVDGRTCRRQKACYGAQMPFGAAEPLDDRFARWLLGCSHMLSPSERYAD